jgi:hypothetical protein
MRDPIPPGHGESAGPGQLARCSICATIIEAYPASRSDGHWQGRCPEHGLVAAVYGDRDEIRARARGHLELLEGGT